MSHQKPQMVLALGGNALIQSGQEGTAQQQRENLLGPMRQVAQLCQSWRVVLTHGNGPQVGNLLLQQHACSDVPEMPLEVLVAQTQGQIGYLIESTLDEALERLGGHVPPLVSLISYVVVDPNDPAFDDPTKPIGPAWSKAEIKGRPGDYRETAKGWRRVVASPEPEMVVEHHEIKQLLAQGFVVICCGGGGIPVTRRGRGFCGVEAVIDKDLASVCLAKDVKADLMVIATDVEGVYLDFGSETSQLLTSLRVPEARAMIEEGCFPAGSMGPKVEAAVRFVEAGGPRAIICHLDHLDMAVQGRAGTEIIPD